MFSTTTVQTAFADLTTDVGVILGIAVVAILGAWAALVGLGWGVRKTSKHVTGKKF